MIFLTVFLTFYLLGCIPNFCYFSDFAYNKFPKPISRFFVSLCLAPFWPIILFYEWSTNKYSFFDYWFGDFS